MANQLDQIIAKGAGLAHEVKARMDGLVGVFDTLAEQHAEASSLLKRAQADASKRAELWPAIRAALRAHEQGELRVVYPVLREYTELTAFADRHATEAEELSHTVASMDAVGPRSERFASMLDRLIGLVEAHATEEETRIFPTAQSVIGEQRARELDKSFISVAKQIKQAEMPPERH